MKKVFIACILLLSQASQVPAQSSAIQEAQLITTNVLFGGITTGFGSLINKAEEEKGWDAFKKGFKYGCLGGVLLYAGKRCSYLIAQKEEDFVIGTWSSRLIHNSGASIMENAALHRPAFSHYNLYVGFFRLEFDWQSRFKFQPRVMPLSLGSMFYSMAAYDAKLDVLKSLQYGTPYLRTYTENDRFGAISVKGNVTFVNYSYPVAQQYYDHLNAHEHIHVLQSQEDYIFNTHIQPVHNYFKSKSGFIRKASKYIYFDLSPFDATTLLYYAAYWNGALCYWQIPHEFEAERISTNKVIDIHEICR